MKSNKPAVKLQNQTIHFQQQLHSGPLPAPGDFQHYNDIYPGAAERILVMAEEEQRHRHLLEKSFAQNNNSLTNERRNGQYMAFTIAVLFPVLGVYLIMNGAKIEGSIFGGVGLIPVIYAFIPKKNISGKGE